MTLTIDIPEKIVERAKEFGVPVSTLVSQTLEVAAAEEDHRPPPMLGTAQPHRIPEFSGPTIFTKAEPEEIERFHRIADAHAQRVTRTPEAALQELVDAGFCHPDGQLTEHYR